MVVDRLDLELYIPCCADGVSTDRCLLFVGIELLTGEIQGDHPEKPDESRIFLGVGPQPPKLSATD